MMMMFIGTETLVTQLVHEICRCGVCDACMSCHVRGGGAPSHRGNAIAQSA
jgi:hypothetical protein